MEVWRKVRAGRNICRANQALSAHGFKTLPVEDYVREMEAKYKTPFEGYFDPLRNSDCEEVSAEDDD